MRALASLGLCVLLACPSSAPEVTSRATPDRSDKPDKPVANSQSPVPAEVMVDHFHDSLRIKNAVIAGELPDVHAAAKHLAGKLASDPFPAPWQPYLRRAADLATAAESAREIPEAAAAAAGLAASCGECHTANNTGPRFPEPGDAPVRDSSNTKSQMARHQWAADRMWEALVSRSDRAWTAGAAALADAPLCLDDIRGDVELPDEVLGLGGRLHALGQRAQTTSDWPTRTTIYGEFLASCATCHKGGC